MMARSMELIEPTATGHEDATRVLANFPDGGAVSVWAKQAVADLLMHGVVTGSTTGLRPTSKITRAEAAVLILRMLEKTGLINSKGVH